jgi:hypothetical protein
MIRKTLFAAAAAISSFGVIGGAVGFISLNAGVPVA